MKPFRSTRRRRAPLSLLAAALAIAPAATAYAGVAPAREEPADFGAMYAAEYLAPFARPAAINQAGDIVGRNPVWGHAFVVTGKRGYAELPCPTPLTACHAVDINEQGWIVGWGESAADGLRGRTALLWRPTADSFSVARVGGSPLAPSRSATSARTEPPAEAVAINAENAILIRPSGALLGDQRIRIWTPRGSYSLVAPGEVVDLSDAGWIAGNGRLPFRLDARTGEVAWTSLPAGFEAARAHAINRRGELAGALLDGRGRSLMAVADADGTWRVLGGVGPDDFAVAISDFGDVVGHAHGLLEGSHCAVQFAGEPLGALEERFAGDAVDWVIGHEVGGMNNQRVIATEATHGVSGLPALLRLVPTGTVRECAGECLVATAIDLEKLASTGPVGSARYAAFVEVETDSRRAPRRVEAEVTWILDGGRRVVRQKGLSDAAGRLRFELEGSAAPVELYVTGLWSDGLRFDPTRGVLRASR
jgi:hypothetical protein